MATHSNILAWRSPWTEEPGRLQSMGLQRVQHDLATNHQQQQSCALRPMMPLLQVPFFKIHSVSLPRALETCSKNLTQWSSGKQSCQGHTPSHKATRKRLWNNCIPSIFVAAKTVTAGNSSLESSCAHSQYLLRERTDLLIFPLGSFQNHKSNS